MKKEDRARYIDERLLELGLGRSAQYTLPKERKTAWRVSPEPFNVTAAQKQTLSVIGKAMQKFYKAADSLYHLGLNEKELNFIVEYLDRGKPAAVVEIGHQARFKGQLPLIQRPDLLMTEEGFIASEFDSIPGGAGLLAGMEGVYRELGYDLPDTGKMFAEALSGIHKSGLLAIVVSEESKDYRAEMDFLAARASEHGLPIVCLAPEDLEMDSKGVYYRGSKIGTIYRFFELFDVDNVKGGHQLLRAAAQGLVQMTPAPKAYLEEKLWFNLLRHHRLVRYWEKSMGKKWYNHLLEIIPQTFILDNRALPPHGVIAGLTKEGQDISSFNELSDLPRSARKYVIKPSGFSPDSWGSKGVILGRDVSTKAWGELLQRALDAFAVKPYILQEFHYSLLHKVTYYDFAEQSLNNFEGKYRYCPYYFTGKGNAVLQGGVLITACPSEKPLIHGMTDAVMGPAS